MLIYLYINKESKDMSKKRNFSKKGKKQFKKDKEGLKNNDLDYIIGKNAVYEYIENGTDILKIYIEEGEGFEKTKSKVLELLDKNTKIKTSEKENIINNIQEISKDKILNYGSRHQGIVLKTKEYRYYTFDEVFKNIDIKKEKPVIAILDKIEDPNNLGSILRSSEIFNISAVVIPKHGSAKVNSTVRKVSVGASEKVPVIEITNINYFIDELKEKGFWIYSADMDGENIYNLDYDNPVALIFGNEGKGISKLTLEKSDFIFKIPMKGTLDSLNVSVSAGISFYEVQKRRGII